MYPKPKKKTKKTVTHGKASQTFHFHQMKRNRQKENDVCVLK